MNITRGFEAHVDRYYFDWGLCNSSNGWAQVDTDQDFQFYGTWANPTALKVFQFCEGDTTVWECANAQEFTQVLQELADFETRSGRKPLQVDGMCNDQIIQAFEGMGLGHWLH